MKNVKQIVEAVGPGDVLYTSGESVYDNTRNDYLSLNQEEKLEHIKELWRLCFLKSMGASNIKRVFQKLHDRVVSFGTTKNINRTRQDIEKKILDQKPKIVLLADDPFKRFWNILMIFLLAYVALYVPYGICFNKSQPGDPITAIEVVDILVDVLFFIDIIVNFISSFDDPDSGLPVISLKKIALNYLTGWFALDLVAVLPV